jgi:hypothetical protein
MSIQDLEAEVERLSPSELAYFQANGLGNLPAAFCRASRTRGARDPLIGRARPLPALSLNPSICERNNLWTLKQHVLVLKTTDYAAARNAALPKRFAYAMRAR